MSTPPSDQTITAYALGELAADEAAEMDNAVAQDPELAAEVEQIRSLQIHLTETLIIAPDHLSPQHREQILTATRASSAEAKIVSIKTWLFTLSAAAVLTFAFFFPQGVKKDSPIASTNPPSQTTPTPPIAPTPVIEAPAENLPPKVARHAGRVAQQPSLDLPIYTEKSDIETLSASEEISLTQLLNTFPLRLAGTATISRSNANNWHPDNRSSGMSTHVATLATELIACPWNPSSTLLLIKLTGNGHQKCEAKVTYNADPKNVIQYRLLGFSEDPALTQNSGHSPLPINATTHLVIEIEPAQPYGNLGSLDWSTDDIPAPSIQLIRKRETEPSDDARFAALVSSFHQWRNKEQVGTLDDKMVLSLIRETSSPSLSPDKAKFLSIIEKSLPATPLD